MIRDFWAQAEAQLTPRSAPGRLKQWLAIAGDRVPLHGGRNVEVDVDGAAAAASADEQGAEREVTFRGHRAPPTLNEHGAAIRSWIAERQISGVR